MYKKDPNMTWSFRTIRQFGKGITNTVSGVI